MPKQLRALDTFFVGNRKVEVGDIVSSSDPITRKNAALFEPVDAVVEQATAAPGEKRTTSRRKNK